MTCAPSAGWFGVKTDLRDEDDLAMMGARVVGRCVVYSGAGLPCAEGLLLRFDRPHGDEPQLLGVWWNKATRAFETVEMRARP